ncbi:MAG: DUF3943 domain-containing protein [Flavisolibacter sp.]
MKPESKTSAMKLRRLKYLLHKIIIILALSGNLPLQPVFATHPDLLFVAGMENSVPSCTLVISADTLPPAADDFLKFKNPDERFKRPAKQITLLKETSWKVAATHLVSLAFLFSSSKEKTNWDDDFGRQLFRHSLTHIKQAWTQWPAMDRDPWRTNYLEHPYAGSFYYNVVRNKGGSAFDGVISTIIGSTAFEYITEAFFEQPSIQDIFVTPVFGSIAGELIHQATMWMARNGFSFTEKLIVLCINPAYVVNHGFKTPSSKKRKQLLEF